MPRNDADLRRRQTSYRALMPRTARLQGPPVVKKTYLPTKPTLGVMRLTSAVYVVMSMYANGA